MNRLHVKLTMTMHLLKLNLQRQYLWNLQSSLVLNQARIWL